jgi:hypothetical protein
MTAAEVKEKLRGRHPATLSLGQETIPGPWITIEEWNGIDFLAFSAHATPPSGGAKGVRYPRIGYEVKISRSDLRRELLAPSKRRQNVDWCNAFYFATPKGLLTKEEIAFEEPYHFRDPRTFSRKGCPGLCQKDSYKHSSNYGKRMRYSKSRREFIECDICEGKGYTDISRAEKEAPTLWVPSDVGLIEVSEGGARIIKSAPTRKKVPDIGGQQLHDLLRWTSVRNDPRHREMRRNNRRR